MSCTNGCCPEPGKISDEYCQVFSTQANTTLYVDALPESHPTTVTISLHETSSTTASVTISLVGGTSIVYTLSPGSSRTDTATTVTRVEIGVAAPGVIEGKSCINTTYVIYK